MIGVDHIPDSASSLYCCRYFTSGKVVVHVEEFALDIYYNPTRYLLPISKAKHQLLCTKSTR